MRFVKDDYELVRSIVQGLEDHERREVCNGEFGDSPYVIYREAVVDDFGNGIAFIDLYQTPDMNNVAVVIAKLGKTEYAHRGYATALVKRAMKAASVHDWELIWPVSKHNKTSIALAKRCGIQMEVK